MKNILFAIILIISAGGLFYVGINSKNDDLIDIQISKVASIFPSKFPAINSFLTEKQPTLLSEKEKDYPNAEKKPEEISANENKTLKNYTYFFLPPDPVTTSRSIAENQRKIYLTQISGEAQNEFESWRDAVESQGYDFNDTETMAKLKSVRLEFQTLAEVEETGNDSLNLHVNNIKEFITENDAAITDFSDNLLLGDLWEKLFETDIKIGKVSSEIKQRYIESFYNIPITLEKELEIAEFSKNNSVRGIISEEKNKEIEEYLASEKYTNLEKKLSLEINPSFNFENSFNSLSGLAPLNTLFAPIGSSGEEHEPTDAGYPLLAGQCGGNEIVPDFPPGYTTFATNCSGCSSSSSYGIYCDRICGCLPPVAYIWDAVTGICGCGE